MHIASIVNAGRENRALPQRVKLFITSTIYFQQLFETIERQFKHKNIKRRGNCILACYNPRECTCFLYPYKATRLSKQLVHQLNGGFKSRHKMKWKISRSEMKLQNIRTETNELHLHYINTQF